ncbi:GNAT family N-acetyltransferase [Mesorhizobium sp. SB112]|uniref:GNAT family N-acetyltransferase n=1 Tax=Mesorhizobium sp. SB112 TaxID=3151853 RepID=UPI00326475CE
MQAEFRTAHPDDLDALVSIENASFRTDLISRKALRRMIASARADVLVAHSGGQIIAYSVVLYRKGSARARLYSIASVGPRGIGRALLDEAEKRAAARGAKSLYLEVREDNARAILSYERNGYARFGVRANYYADGATALRYQKQLIATERMRK